MWIVTNLCSQHVSTQFSKKMEQMEEKCSTTSQAQDVDSARRLLQIHQELKKSKYSFHIWSSFSVPVCLPTCLFVSFSVLLSGLSVCHSFCLSLSRQCMPVSTSFFYFLILPLFLFAFLQYLQWHFFQIYIFKLSLFALFAFVDVRLSLFLNNCLIWINWPSVFFSTTIPVNPQMFTCLPIHCIQMFTLILLQY